MFLTGIPNCGGGGICGGIAYICGIPYAGMIGGGGGMGGIGSIDPATAGGGTGGTGGGACGPTQGLDVRIALYLDRISSCSGDVPVLLAQARPQSSPRLELRVQRQQLLLAGGRELALLALAPRLPPQGYSSPPGTERAHRQCHP